VLMRSGSGDSIRHSVPEESFVRSHAAEAEHEEPAATYDEQHYHQEDDGQQAYEHEEEAAGAEYDEGY